MSKVVDVMRAEDFNKVLMVGGQITGVSVQHERESNVVHVQFFEDEEVVQQLTMVVHSAQMLRRVLDTMKVLDEAS